jgi:hypothetical protein
MHFMLFMRPLGGAMVSHVCFNIYQLKTKQINHFNRIPAG